MLFVDGVTQNDLKTPSAWMLHDPVDDSDSVISTLDVTYATTYKWNKSWASANGNSESGFEWEPETTDPRALGFPADVADRVSLPTTLHGRPDWGFLGFYQYRAFFNPVNYNTRSTALVRDHEHASYFVVSDIMDKGDTESHTYSWEMTLKDETTTPFASLGDSAIVLSSTAPGEQRKKLAVHAVSNTGLPLQFSIGDIMSRDGSRIVARRLFVRPQSSARGAVRFSVILHPFIDGRDSTLAIKGDGFGNIILSHGATQKRIESGSNSRLTITNLLQGQSSAAWSRLASRPADPLPPTMLQSLPSDGDSWTSVNPQLQQSASSSVLDLDLMSEGGYEHLFALLPEHSGKYEISHCAMETAGQSSVNLYRPGDWSGAVAFETYQRCDMDKYSLSVLSRSCSFRVALEAFTRYILGGVWELPSLEVSYALA